MCVGLPCFPSYPGGTVSTAGWEGFASAHETALTRRREAKNRISFGWIGASTQAPNEGALALALVTSASQQLALLVLAHLLAPLLDHASQGLTSADWLKGRG